MRKRKELELQILTEAIRNWEGDDIKTLGSVVYMSQVLIQCAGSEVLPSAFPAFLSLGGASSKATAPGWLPLPGTPPPQVPSLRWAVFLLSLLLDSWASLCFT